MNRPNVHHPFDRTLLKGHVVDVDQFDAIGTPPQEARLVQKPLIGERVVHPKTTIKVPPDEHDPHQQYREHQPSPTTRTEIGPPQKYRQEDRQYRRPDPVAEHRFLTVAAAPDFAFTRLFGLACDSGGDELRTGVFFGKWWRALATGSHERIDGPLLAIKLSAALAAIDRVVGRLLAAVGADHDSFLKRQSIHYGRTPNVQRKGRCFKLAFAQ